MFIAYFALSYNGLLHILHYLQWFIAYCALFCNGLLHIWQWFIAYFALQVVAGVMQREEEWWIGNADGVKAATALLPFTRPGELNVWLLDSTPTQALHQLAATIKQTAFGGQLQMGLYHSHKNFIPCDVKDLHGAK